MSLFASDIYFAIKENGNFFDVDEKRFKVKMHSFLLDISQAPSSLFRPVFMSFTISERM